MKHDFKSADGAIKGHAELKKENFDHFHPVNTSFSEAEKEELKKLNELLGKNEYNLGLLIAFYYGTPNNTMPLIWKDGFKYTRADGEHDAWFALLPRKY